MNTATTQLGRLFLVGVGPGDPELLTRKACRVLRSCPVWAVPVAQVNGADGSSTALDIARAALPDAGARQILQLNFLMKPVQLGGQGDPEQEAAWQEAARQVLAVLEQGQDLAFPTLGDVAIYSTAFYLLASLHRLRPEVEAEIIPGISAISACAAGQQRPLALGDDLLAVVPAVLARDRLRQVLTSCDAVALMKAHRHLDELIELLDELGLLAQAVLVERAGLPGERVFSDLRQARGQQLHYFTTVLVRKKPFPVQP